MTGETRDKVLAYTGYDHSDHSITFLGPTGRVSEKIYYLLFVNNKNMDWLNLFDMNSSSKLN